MAPNPCAHEDTRMRRAGPADAAAVRELTRTAYAKWIPLIGREPLPMVADYDRAVREHMIDLLLLDDQLVALIETVDKADHLLIENVAVAPPFQGRGFGRRLLAHAERLAASLQLPELRLYTNQRFVSNIELYRRSGYAIDREEPFKGGFVVHMSKRLAAD
jgi:GNAT superfamily N-acetyltransferase